MNRIVFLTLAFFAAVATAQYDGSSTPSPPSRSCPLGQVWDNCPGACLEPHCADEGMVACAGLLSCPPPACQCDRSQGYARDKSSGRCIRRDACPASASNPCMTVKCSAGFVCQANGDGTAGCVKAPTPVPLNACAATSCPVGSLCVEREGRGICTGPAPSSNCSLPHEQWRQCGTCERTCDNRNPFCNRMCQPARCECGAGFFRSKEGKCVTANECDIAAESTKCPANEIFHSCSSMCEPQCGQYEPMACILMCGPPKCQCAPGFYRNSAGKCVSRADCATPTCKKGEIYAQCSSMCIPKCGEYEVRPCMALCGPPKCQCDRGFYLDSKGNCVTRQECDKQSSTPKTPSQADCKPNEKFNECSTMCEEKCGEYVPTRACPASCGPPSCQCEIGFYRNKDGDCVSRSDCDLEESNPITCANIDCVSGNLCQMKDGKPVCVLGPTLTCAMFDCAPGYHCEVTNGAPGCVPNKQALTCNTVKCAGGHRCQILPSGQPSCVPETTPSITCANVRCAGPCTDTPSGPVCGTRPNVCGPNEEWRTCSNPCFQPFCGDEGIMRNCITACSPPACECSKGFVRDRATKRCVKREQCTGGLRDPCARMNCGINGRCVSEGGKPKCLPIFTASISSPRVSALPSLLSLHSLHSSIALPSGPSLPLSCDQVTCGKDEICMMEQVKCLSGPCQGGVPKCKGGIAAAFALPPHADDQGLSSLQSDAIDASPSLSPSSLLPSSVPVPTCESHDCPVGEMCTLPPMACPRPPCTRRPTCVKDPLYLPGDEIVPSCDGHFCPPGQTCKLQEVVCIRAPCYPIPSCEPDPACPLPCPLGQTCVLQQVQCIRAPCPPRPACRPLQIDPAPETCAALLCAPGTKCVLERIPCFVAPCKNRAVCRPTAQTCSKAHEYWDQCFHGCESTCQERNKACTEQCGPGGCACDSGYIRDEQTGECVRSRECPRLYAGPRTCEGVYCRRDMQCQMRRGVPVCLRRPSSDQPIVMGTMPPTVTCESLGCGPGERCVTKSYGPQCESVECGANEEYDRCMNGCEATCDAPHPVCTKECGPGGCRCRIGYVRSNGRSNGRWNGRCIEEKQCRYDPIPLPYAA